MQPRQRIVADRTQRDDLVAGLQAQGIVDLDGRHFGIARKIAGPAVMCLILGLRRIIGLIAFGTWHVGWLPCKNEILEIRLLPAGALRRSFCDVGRKLGADGDGRLFRTRAR
jgi:hypothetical protein